MSLRNLQIQNTARSMGVKLAIICALALAMTIPTFLVGGLVDERTERSAQVRTEISRHVGGPQTLLGPTLAIPYRIPSSSPVGSTRSGVYLVFPAKASATLRTTTEERHRSLFRVPVFQADVVFEAGFDLAGVGALAPPDAELDWKQAEIVVGLSDARGAVADATLTKDATTVALQPAEVTDQLVINSNKDEFAKLALFGVRMGNDLKPNAVFPVRSSLRISGADRIAVLAYGKTTHVAAHGDWPNPGFYGGILPIRRSVGDDGFTAEWSVPFIARGVRAEGPVESIAGLNTTALGMTFAEVADPYQSVNRALKYALLCLGLVFFRTLFWRRPRESGFTPHSTCSSGWRR